MLATAEVIDALSGGVCLMASVGKHFDSGDLFLHVTPQGGKCWRLKYRFAGKEKLLALGVFPEVSLVFRCAKPADRYGRIESVEFIAAE